MCETGEAVGSVEQLEEIIKRVIRKLGWEVREDRFDDAMKVGGTCMWQMNVWMKVGGMCMWRRTRGV